MLQYGHMVHIKLLNLLPMKAKASEISSYSTYVFLNMPISNFTHVASLAVRDNILQLELV